MQVGVPETSCFQAFPHTETHPEVLEQRGVESEACSLATSNPGSAVLDSQRVPYELAGHEESPAPLLPAL